MQTRAFRCLCLTTTPSHQASSKPFRATRHTATDTRKRRKRAIDSILCFAPKANPLPFAPHHTKANKVSAQPTRSRPSPCTHTHTDTGEKPKRTSELAFTWSREASAKQRAWCCCLVVCFVDKANLNPALASKARASCCQCCRLVEEGGGHEMANRGEKVLSGKELKCCLQNHKETTRKRRKTQLIPGPSWELF